MKAKKITALLLTTAMVAGALSGCDTTVASGDIIDYDMFIAMPGAEINEGNEIQEMIAEKTGVRVHETWLTGQTADEAVGTIIASGDLPELIDGGDGMHALYEAGSLIAWDDYIDKYPNIKEMYSDEEWDRFRQDDGHIYWAISVELLV